MNPLEERTEDVVTPMFEGVENLAKKYPKVPQKRLDKMVRLFLRLLELYCKKNSDYGDSFSRSLDELGIMAFVVRADDKMNRIKQLAKNKEAHLVEDEPLDKTIADQANYAMMYLLWRVEQGVEPTIE